MKIHYGAAVTVATALAFAVPVPGHASPTADARPAPQASQPKPASHPSESMADEARVGKHPKGLLVQMDRWGRKPQLRFTANVDLYRKVRKDARHKADEVTLQVLVQGVRPTPKKASLQRRSFEVAGPVIELTGGGRKGNMTDRHRLADARVRKADGRVSATLRLTGAQARALRKVEKQRGKKVAASRIFVRIQHHKDVKAGTSRHELTQVAGTGVSSTRAPQRDARSLSDDFVGNVATFHIYNDTNNPMVLMAAPISCMYDTRYRPNATLYNPSGAQLGSLTGMTLAPKSIVSVQTISDSQNLDGPTRNWNGNAVFSAYAKAIDDAAARYGAETPDWAEDPGSGTLGPDAVRKQQISQVLNDAITSKYAGMEQKGATDALKSTASMYQQTMAAVGRELAGEATGLLGVAGAYLAPIGAITFGLMDLIESGCNASPSYFALGATDATQPWVSFSQVYNFGAGKPMTAKNDSDKFLVPSANGIISNKRLYAGWQRDEGVNMATDQPWTPLKYKSSDFDKTLWTLAESDTPSSLANLYVCQGGGQCAQDYATCWSNPTDNYGSYQRVSAVNSIYDQPPYLAPDPVQNVYQMIPNAFGYDTSGGTHWWAYQMPWVSPYNYGILNDYIFENDSRYKTGTLYFSKDGVSWTEEHQFNEAYDTAVPVPSWANYVKCTNQDAQLIEGVDAYGYLNGPDPSLNPDNPVMPDKTTLAMGTQVPSNVWARDEDGFWRGTLTREQQACQAKGGDYQTGTGC